MDKLFGLSSWHKKIHIDNGCLFDFIKGNLWVGMPSANAISVVHLGMVWGGRLGIIMMVILSWPVVRSVMVVVILCWTLVAVVVIVVVSNSLPLIILAGIRVDAQLTLI